MTGRVLVIGATGAVGGRVAKGLLGKGLAVRGATRDPEGATRDAGDGLGFIEFDYERPETFAPALEGVDRVFLVARPGDEHPDRVAAPLIEEMGRQGVQRVVNLTAMGVETRDDLALRRVELMLEESGIGFTHLRPNWFMQVFSSGPLHAAIRRTGRIRLPVEDAKISWIDVRDIAGVATAVLTESGHVGRAYTLTGGEALDHDEVAALIAEASGTTVGYESISEDEMRQAVVAAGLGPALAERQIGFYRLVRAGFCAPVSRDVRAVLGRDPIRFERFAREYAGCWT